VAAAAVRRSPSFPVDRDLPGAADLLADAGMHRVARFLDGRGLDPYRVEPAQANYRPGRWLAVCYRTAAVERTSGRPMCPTVTMECRAGEADLVWAFPDDPALPGLAAATDGVMVRRRLRPRPVEVVVEPLRYRPRRRAVLRYRVDGNRVLFGKVVTPRRGRRLLKLAEALRSTGLRLALPTAQTGPGALVLPVLSGRPLRDLLQAGGPLPSPDRVAGLSVELHQRCAPVLDSADCGTTRRVVDPGTALCVARIVSRLLPEEACAAGRLAEAVVGWAEESELPATWVVHGDLYENQVVVDGETLGLVDLDDIGLGDPLLDAANFAAHLRVLAASGPPAAAVIHRYREELRAAFLRRLDADSADLAWREAYCLLRLATGPFRVLHPEWPRRMADRLTLATEALSVRR
jgi:phosphotransferase family enzyme